MRGEHFQQFPKTMSQMPNVNRSRLDTPPAGPRVTTMFGQGALFLNENYSQTQSRRSEPHTPECFCLFGSQDWFSIGGLSAYIMQALRAERTEPGRFEVYLLGIAAGTHYTVGAATVGQTASVSQFVQGLYNESVPHLVGRRR